MSTIKPVIIFPHIAKTAGVTAGSSLNQAFHGHKFGGYFQKKVSGTGLVDLDYIAAKFNKLSTEEKQKVMFIPGHMGFGLHTHLPFECKYITFVRNPVDRIISTYNYVLDRGWLDPKYSFEDFINMGFLGSTNNMVRTLSGDTSLDTHEKPALQNHAREVTEEDFARTMQNIEEHFVSCIPVSSYDMGLIDFFCQWDLPPAAMLYTRQNITKTKRTQKNDLSETTLGHIRELNSFDIRLYRKICEMFDKRYQENKGRYDRIASGLSNFQNIFRMLSKLREGVEADSGGDKPALLYTKTGVAECQNELRKLTNKFIDLTP